jgi:NTP pyrophosphatase (non-canonical NTP hydrolase)
VELSALIRQQIEADSRRGFLVDFATDAERHDQLVRDLVGLFGEVGEFANLLKKVGLRLSHEGYKGPTLTEASSHLREELADAVIYIFRLSAILNGDLEQDLREKMRVNDNRYRALES